MMPLIIELDGCFIDIRPAVAVREVRYCDHHLYYLSIFDGEIEERLEELLRHSSDISGIANNLSALASALEPTDAVLIAHRKNFVVARGGACSFPLYWRVVEHALRVSTSLAIDDEVRLSRRGIANSIAVVSVSLQNEPNLSLEAPLAGWRRFRRGAVSRLSTSIGLLSEQPLDLANVVDEEDQGSLIDDLQIAFDRFGRRQANLTRLVEWSGGIDSTLAAVHAVRHGANLAGVSVSFPYYEFRFEEEIQRTAADEIGISRQSIEGADFLSFTPAESSLKLDEPATISMAIARDITIANIAARMGADQVLVGQGGDQLFSEDMLSPVPPPSALTRAAFTLEGWRAVEDARERMTSSTEYLRRSRLTYLHDARLDPAIKEAIGVVTRSPFSDIAVVRCGIRWAGLCSKRGTKEGKRLLSDAFAGVLPSVVTDRRGKVSWDGVLARTYWKNEEALGVELERSATLLQQLGFNMKWLMRRVGELANWHRTSFGYDDREVFVAYSVAQWLREWKITQISDLSLAD